MKTKLYIVTYKNIERITNNIASIRQSSFLDNPLNEIIIINNSPSVNLDFLANERIGIIPNTLRHESSIAHLSQSWNQCLVNGFVSLSSPDCDLVVTSQDDVVFDHDWYEVVINNHQKYDFMAFGTGDMVCSYTTDAIKKAGIWDENFPGLSWKESDYFQRNVMWNKNRTSLNDVPGHLGMVWNPIRQIALRTQPGFDVEHMRSDGVHYHNLEYFRRKWPTLKNTGATTEYFENLAPTKPSVGICYSHPHFEKDIENVLDKGYFYDFVKQGYLVHY